MVNTIDNYRKHSVILLTTMVLHETIGAGSNPAVETLPCVYKDKPFCLHCHTAKNGERLTLGVNGVQSRGSQGPRLSETRCKCHTTYVAWKRFN